MARTHPVRADDDGMSAPSSYATERPGTPGSAPPMTAWIGMVAFGGFMIVLTGIFHLIEGIVALADDDFYVARPAGLALSWSYTQWGWLHVVVGVLALAAGTGIFLGQLWARVAGVAIALVSAFASMLYLPAYPLWSVILIVIDVLIIYALLAHGGDVRD
ncbi:DUF7144 family membrane protein [Actinoplanes sp. CA-030573]|uniref:DUF7144 family membrane protein n=1 Tax=Actinoplanes sp. CA-030573 TaxID=3239898 RepID=UPI003D8AB12F